jgi:hypothetical protein
MGLNSETLAALFEEQLVSWKQAGDNYKALEGVVVKNIDVNGYPFKVQFNPARIVSSSAKVDKKSIKERKCFLCAANRPEVQKGISYIDESTGGEYVVLINPFPIFPRHLTIPLTEHKDQLISGKMGVMLSLSEKLPGFTLFYNGPKCGASAPDHFHFQAGNKGFLTIEKELSSMDQDVLFDNDGLKVSAVNSVFKGLYAIESSDLKKAEEAFEKIFAVLPVKEGEKEPMVNILTWFDEGAYTILLYARDKHRPSHYFAEGDDNILLSPASVDMGGVLITPLEKDFNKMDAAIIKEILDEICVSEEEGRVISNKIKTVL